MSEFLKNLSPSARWGLGVGVVAIVLGLSAASWWLLRPQYQVLFSDLKPQDAQAMTVELERLKIPYKLGDSGAAILVEESAVHGTRIKLMGKDLPLHGAVGFELFNNTDFGMTEFAQKINYQRALQGEITRTILSMAEIKDARVHLAMPESGLFKQATARAKASINLSLRQGESLRNEQVHGIQRLVAAAVPGMTTQDVTIVDNRGVALTRSAGADGESDGGAGRLDLKRDTENYLNKKAMAVLEQMFGAGQALASVDVTLNMDQMRVTTEDVIGSPSKTGGAQTGVLIRERETARDATPPLETRSDASGRSSGTTQREADYAVGRRVEQIVGQPGSIRRLQVVAVVRKPLSVAQEEQVQRLLSAAVGALPERGDGVVVQTLLPGGANGAEVAPTSVAESESISTREATQATATGTPGAASDTSVIRMMAGLLLGLLLLVVLAQLLRKPKVPPAAAMSEAQRQVALQRVQEWMAQTPAPDRSGDSVVARTLREGAHL